MTVTLFLLSETCSDAQTCLVSNDLHGEREESLSPGDTLFVLMLRGVAAPNVLDLSLKTDAEMDTETVNTVKMMDSQVYLLDLSSSHYDLSGTYRFHMHQS